MQDNDEIRERQIKDAPFCWQHKESLQMIRDYITDGNGHSASALAIYLALTELASDQQSETFTATISQVKQRAGVSYRTAANFLKRLEANNLIAVQRSTIPGTKGNAPSTYTLLTPLGNHCLTLGKQTQKCLPRYKKKGKNLKKPPIVPQGGRGFVNVSRLRRSRNGAKPMSIAHRNKLINRLNERKARVMHTFPDGHYAPWATEELAKIQRALETL
jgi:hypothetical protein